MGKRIDHVTASIEKKTRPWLAHVAGWEAIQAVEGSTLYRWLFTDNR
jgi:hypothetical protein